MRRILKNSDLIVGRKYYCKSKLGGTLSIEEVFMDGHHAGPHPSDCKYVGKGRIWAVGPEDNVYMSGGGEQYINDQALAKWDIIGPIPEINLAIADALFKHQDLLDRMSPFDNEASCLILNDGSIGFNNGDVITVDNLDEYIKDNCIVVLPEKTVTIAAQDSSPSFLPLGLENIGLIGRRVKLTEDKYNESGLFPEGMLVTIMGWLDGGSAGYLAVDATTCQRVALGWDGFKLID